MRSPVRGQSESIMTHFGAQDALGMTGPRCGSPCKRQRARARKVVLRWSAAVSAAAKADTRNREDLHELTNRRTGMRAPADTNLKKPKHPRRRKLHLL